MISFATDKPTDYLYDSGADVLYVLFSGAPVVRTIELLEDWPLILVDVDAEDKVIGIEYAGIKQFGAYDVGRLLRKRDVLSPDLADQFSAYLQTPDAEALIAK
ncbi:MAG: DUF2283 domain-containing protein [Verrucomicrobia bacterium]|nr:DUF2283 domain-containing protein [Verrucomicrobiota bacterium]